eukprot:Gb_02323 [translate_table: standard]
MTAHSGSRRNPVESQVEEECCMGSESTKDLLRNQGENSSLLITRNESTESLAGAMVSSTSSPMGYAGNPEDQGGAAVGMNMNQSRVGLVQGAMDTSEDTGDEDALDDYSSLQQPDQKKRRLTLEQVRSLEKNFELENKLEPEKKVQLAQELGLQPRQVAVWFQNRRARWKTKQLERDYDLLKLNYDTLKSSCDSLKQEREILSSQAIHQSTSILTGLKQKLEQVVDKRREEVDNGKEAVALPSIQTQLRAGAGEELLDIKPGYNGRRALVLKEKEYGSSSSSSASLDTCNMNNNYSMINPVGRLLVFNSGDRACLNSDSESCSATLNEESPHNPPLANSHFFQFNPTSSFKLSSHGISVESDDQDQGLMQLAEAISYGKAALPSKAIYQQYLDAFLHEDEPACSNLFANMDDQSATLPWWECP